MSDHFTEVTQLLRTPRHYNSASASVVLMREYLRREAIWAHCLGIAADLPFADLPHAVLSGVDFASRFEDAISSFASSTIESQCLTNMLNWYGMLQQSNGRIESFQFPDPYLPLLRIFSVGGAFSREHRIFIDVNDGWLHAGMIQNGPLEKEFIAVE